MSYKIDTVIALLEDMIARLEKIERHLKIPSNTPVSKQTPPKKVDKPFLTVVKSDSTEE